MSFFDNLTECVSAFPLARSPFRFLIFSSPPSSSDPLSILSYESMCMAQQPHTRVVNARVPQGETPSAPPHVGVHTIRPHACVHVMRKCTAESLAPEFLNFKIFKVPLLRDAPAVLLVHCNTVCIFFFLFFPLQHCLRCSN